MFFLHVVKMCHTKSIGTLTWIGIWHCRKMFKMLSVVPLCQAALKFGTSGTYVYVFWAGTPSSSGVVSLSLWPQFWCSLPMDCATSQWWTTCKWDMNTIMIKYVRAVVSIYIFSTTTWFDLKLRTKKGAKLCVCVRFAEKMRERKTKFLSFLFWRMTMMGGQRVMRHHGLLL